MFGRPFNDLADDAAIKRASGCRLKTSATSTTIIDNLCDTGISQPAITLLERNVISVMTLIEWSGMLSQERSANQSLTTKWNSEGAS